MATIKEVGLAYVYLDRLQHGWLVVVGAVHLGSDVLTGSDHAAALAVDLHELGQVEAGLLQNLHLQEGGGRVLAMR